MSKLKNYQKINIPIVDVRRTLIIAEMMDKKFDNVIFNSKSGITSGIDEKLIAVKPQY